jgi:hypothetical protein
MRLPRCHGLSFPVSSLCTLTPCVACRRGCPWLYNERRPAPMAFSGWHTGPRHVGYPRGLEENVLPETRAVCDIRATYVGIMRKACAWADLPLAGRTPPSAYRQETQSPGAGNNPYEGALHRCDVPIIPTSVWCFCRPGGHRDRLPKERGEVTLVGAPPVAAAERSPPLLWIRWVVQPCSPPCLPSHWAR